MSDGSGLVRTFQKIAKVSDSDISDLVSGTVTSINPIEINVNDKLKLTEDFLILGPMVVETIIDAVQVLPGGGTQIGHTHVVTGTYSGTATSSLTKLRLWRDLKVGDKVFMLRIARGQLYYVLQREEGVV